MLGVMLSPKDNSSTNFLIDLKDTIIEVAFKLDALNIATALVYLVKFLFYIVLKFKVRKAQGCCNEAEMNYSSYCRFAELNSIQPENKAHELSMDFLKQWTNIDIKSNQT